MIFQSLLLDRVGARVRRRPSAARRSAARSGSTPIATTSVGAVPCTHQPEALTCRPAGSLSRTWIQTCECGAEWIVQP
ncbi:hypothetical protein Ga0074812_11553 [Parafrankia irregularis]|uniref:Uncharacterized protein n=1 Tax=Parafrankia irregularis TaxID=795642 RepID=A0A0S4QQ74_9ACTN|nr:hypothetical protein Ga0074812_11553 [Parafrankia irregularis]